MMKSPSPPGGKGGDYVNPGAGRHYRALSDISPDERDDIITLSGFGISRNAISRGYKITPSALRGLVGKSEGHGKKRVSANEFRSAVMAYSSAKGGTARRILLKHCILPLVNEINDSAIGSLQSRSQPRKGIPYESLPLDFDKEDWIMKAISDYVESSLDLPGQSYREYKQEMIGFVGAELSEILGRRMLENDKVDIPYGRHAEQGINICYGRDKSPEELCLRHSIEELTKNVMTTLTSREEAVLRKRFGVGERTRPALEEVGRYFDVTRERIRQIEAKALRKLRHPRRRMNIIEK